MLQYMSTFSKFKKKKKTTKFVMTVVWNKRKEREEFVLCEDFSGTPSCLSLHCFDCFCTVYTRVSARVRGRLYVCVVCMYVSVCIGILSVTSQLLSPNFHWGRNAP